MGQKFILVMLEMLMTTKAVPLAIAYTIVEAVFLLLQTAVKPMESDESDAKAATLVMVQLVTMLFGVFFVMEVAIEGGTIHTLMTFSVLAGTRHTSRTHDPAGGLYEQRPLRGF